MLSNKVKYALRDYRTGRVEDPDQPILKLWEDQDFRLVEEIEKLENAVKFCIERLRVQAGRLRDEQYCWGWGDIAENLEIQADALEMIYGEKIK